MNLKIALFPVLVFSLVVACSDKDPLAPGSVGASDAQHETIVAALSIPDVPPAARLPKGVTPRHYRLSLLIDPEQDDFAGTVEIDIDISAPTDRFWIHGKDISVQTVLATLADGREIVLDYEQRADPGVALLSASETLPAGMATLSFEYTAPFNTVLEGLFKVQNGGVSYAFTQFEATSARLAFPGFDEPGFKVPFDISLTIPASQVAVTNTPQISETLLDNGLKRLDFARTRPLPTYLIAFAVGPFDVVEGPPIPAAGDRKTAIPLRGITTRGKGAEIEYALQNTAPIVAAMEDYFGTPYPYAKLDLIAVPGFTSAAMENAGAITYGEQLILLDEGAPEDQKRSFFGVHAHELAHQWFGNLVTPVWWDDIWLNESFATWNAYIILDKLFPEEGYREALQDLAAGVMTDDALASARQIREPIVRHEDIGSAFNGITYRKGGGVLSMFEAFMGRDAFRDGVRLYMQTHAWGNTTAEDFIGAIADANPQVNGSELRAAFMSYIEQPGIPLVNFELQCQGGAISLKVRQQRYLPSGSQGSSDQEWVVPACTSFGAEGNFASQCFLLKGAASTVALNTERCPDHLLPNSGGTSYYRWNLPPEQWQSLLARFDSLTVNEQISVASNLSAGLHSGAVSLTDYLAAAPRLASSSSFRAALIPRDDAYKIRDYVANDVERIEMQRRIDHWYRPQLQRLNQLEQLSSEDTIYRKLMMSTLALGAQDPEMRKLLADYGAAFAGFGTDERIHPDAVDPNLRNIALLVAAEDLGKPYADLLWQHTLAADNALLRKDMIYALGHATEPATARKMRESILSSELRDNEIFYIISAQMGKPESRQAMWNWSRDNLDAILERTSSWRKGHLPKYFATFCSREAADQVESLFRPIIDNLESGNRNLANSLETILLCAAFVDIHRSEAEQQM